MSLPVLTPWMAFALQIVRLFVPTVAELRAMASALEARSVAMKEDSKAVECVELAERGLVYGHALWEGTKLQCWVAKGREQPTHRYYRWTGIDISPTFEIESPFPPMVADALQVIAATYIDEAAGILSAAPKHPSSSTELVSSADAAERAARPIKEAAFYESVANACITGHATLNVSCLGIHGNRGGYLRERTSACIHTTDGLHVCVIPEWDSPSYANWCCIGPYAGIGSCCIRLDYSGSRTHKSRHRAWDHADREKSDCTYPGDDRLTTMLATIFGDAVRAHYGWTVTEREPLQIEERTFRTLRIAG